MTRVSTRIYSANPKINRVLNVLLEYNRNRLWDAVNDYVAHEASEWSETEVWELFRAARWVEYAYLDSH